jgi:hypothetical protein
LGIFRKFWLSSEFLLRKILGEVGISEKIQISIIQAEFSPISGTPAETKSPENRRNYLSISVRASTENIHTKC